MPLNDLVCLWLQEDEAGGEQDALALYQHGLGELLLLLAGEAPSPYTPKPLAALPSPRALPLSAAEPPGRRRELLHTEVPTGVGRLGGLPLPRLPRSHLWGPPWVPSGCSKSGS